jgi:hypothetical protein
MPDQYFQSYLFRINLNSEDFALIRVKVFFLYSLTPSDYTQNQSFDDKFLNAESKVSIRK